MRRSLVRLILSSVLVCWALGFVVVVLWGRSQTWTLDRARRDGVLLAHQILDRLPSARRARRLAELSKHFRVKLSLVGRSEVQRRAARRVKAGEVVHHAESPRAQWFFVVFNDGQGALAAGPVNPAIPVKDFLPIGIIIAIFGLPAIAALVAVRVERRLRRVETASQALAGGQLGARVGDEDGRSDELATTFNAMAERVEQLIRSRDQLVQAVSHELGSPLSRLRFHMELLDGPSADGERHEQRLAAMTRELDALDELVTELLSYVQSDELVLDQQAFDPQRGLSDVAELARLEAPVDGELEIVVELAPDVVLVADQRLFLRAVENVLRNAVRYARTTVKLELAHEGHDVRVAVHDDGPGIPEELRDKVTTPFFRPASDRDRQVGGAGLGLAIVKRIVDRHDGRLVIDESPLGGAMVVTRWRSCGSGSSSATTS